MVALSPIVSMALSAAAAAAIPPYTCTDLVVPVNITAQTTQLNLDAPSNPIELTGLITRLVSATSNVTAEVIGGKTTLTASYSISSQLCVPADFPQNGTLEFAIHGINFDRSYWSFGGKNSEYNYVEQAIRAGHAIFTYDRLGIGQSSKPDGIKEVQAATEVAIADSLISYLRKGVQDRTFGTIIGVGHSFGSIQLVGLAAQYGNVVDALVLTGFSTSTEGENPSVAAFALTPASKQNSLRFGNLPPSYLATGGIRGDQLTFFHYPAFKDDVLELAEATKGTLTIGELLTQGEPMNAPASGFTGPVLVVTGDKDFIFCDGNCYRVSPNLLEPSRNLFPQASSFATYIPAETGHAVNCHLSAPQTFMAIQDWIAKNI